MWDYLESMGVLEKGTDEEIRHAKAKYRKEYITKYKRQQRSKTKEYMIRLQIGYEMERIEKASKEARLPMHTYMKQAVFAYLNNSHIIPNIPLLTEIHILLSNCLNTVKAIANKKERFYYGPNKKIEDIEERIIALENTLTEKLKSPAYIKP